MAEKFIFKTTEEIRAFVTVNKAATFALFTPALRTATNRFIKPILGATELTNLIDAHDAGTESLAQQTLLPYVQAAAAHYMIGTAMPDMAVHFSDMGVQEVAAKDGTSAGLRQWVYYELIGQHLDQGDQAAEELLQFLQGKEGDYPFWAASPEYVAQKALFLGSATELGQYLDARGSFRVYQAARPFFSMAERQHVLPWICQAQFDVLKAEHFAGTLTPESEALLEKIKPVVAYYGIYELSKVVNVWLSADGMRMPSTGNYSSGQSTKAADIEVREQYRQQILGMAQAAETLLQKFILESISDYPMISAGDCNPSVKVIQPYQIPSQRDQKSWRVP